MPARVDPELTARLAKATVDTWSAVTADLLRLVASRLASGIDRPGWAERRLLDTVQVRDRAAAVLAELSTAEDIEAAIVAAHEAGAADAAADLRRAGLTPAEPAVPGRRAVDALVSETVERVNIPQQAVLRWADDVYRSVVSEAAARPVAGHRTRRQAAQQALDRFAMQGVTGFTDRSGRRWGLESYTEMAMRTSVARSQVAGTLDRFTEAGQDIVVVSDAPQECRLCRPFEMQLLSISGASVGQTVDQDRRVIDSVAGARGRGLFHPNCRHTTGLFVPGLTNPPPEHGTADPDGDQARQELRRLERGARQWRRREAAAMDDRSQALARRHLRQWQARIRAHTDETGLIRQRHRERLGAR